MSLPLFKWAALSQKCHANIYRYSLYDEGSTKGDLCLASAQPNDLHTCHGTGLTYSVSTLKYKHDFRQSVTSSEVMLRFQALWSGFQKTSETIRMKLLYNVSLNSYIILPLSLRWGGGDAQFAEIICSSVVSRGWDSWYHNIALSLNGFLKLHLQKILERENHLLDIKQNIGVILGSHLYVPVGREVQTCWKLTHFIFMGRVFLKSQSTPFSSCLQQYRFFCLDTLLSASVATCYWVLIQ